MTARGQRGAMARIEVLTVLIILLVAGSMLAGYLARAHAASRRTTCLNNMKQLGLGFHNYASAQNGRFPGSADVQNEGDNRKVTGWSFYVRLLPYMEYADLYDKLDPGKNKAPKSSDANVQKALNRSIAEFVCPDNRNPLFFDPKSDPPTGALTNYKAMGATCQQSLTAVLSNQPKLPYGENRRMHPDGALYPKTGDIRMADLSDGTSRTILCAETMDDKASRWMVGREVTLIGLPNATVVGAELDARTQQFYAPKGFDGKFGPDSAVNKAGYRTYLSYDFQVKDAGKYEDPGFGRPAAAYGPSSAHAGVVNHLFGDGSVLAIKKDLDPAAYMFMVTRAGNDPSIDMDQVTPKKPSWRDIFSGPKATTPKKTKPPKTMTTKTVTTKTAAP